MELYRRDIRVLLAEDLKIQWIEQEKGIWSDCLNGYLAILSQHEFGPLTLEKNIWLSCSVLPYAHHPACVLLSVMLGTDHKIFFSVKMFAVSDEAIEVIDSCCAVAAIHDRLHVAPWSIIIFSSWCPWRHWQGSAHHWLPLLLTSHHGS